MEYRNICSGSTDEQEATVIEDCGLLGMLAS